MPTLIDSLVVELGLDPSKFDEGRRRAIDAFRRTGEESGRVASTIEKDFAGVEQTFVAIQGRLLGLAAIFLGGMGITDFAAHIVNLTSKLGYLSKQLGQNAQDLYAWGATGSLVGAGADSIIGSIRGLSQSLSSGALHGVSGAQKYFMAMGMAPRLDPKTGAWNPDQLVDIARWGQGQKPQIASQLWREMGFSDDLINLLLQGPEAIRKKLEEMRRLAPTDAQIKAAQEAARQFNETIARTQALFRDLAIEVLPLFNAGLEKVLKLMKIWQEGDKHGDERQKRLEDQLHKKFGPSPLTEEGPIGRLNDWTGGRLYDWGLGAPNANAQVRSRWGTFRAPGVPETAAPSAAPSGGVSGGIDRSSFHSEVEQNPALVRRAAMMVKGEVGLGSDPRKERIELETAFNRAQARGTSLRHALLSVSENPHAGYYASDTYSRPVSDAELEWFKKNVWGPVMSGSDEGTKFLGTTPTGNASQLGFAGRRLQQGYYSAGKWYSGVPGRGEMFVQERSDAARLARNPLPRLGNVWAGVGGSPVFWLDQQQMLAAKEGVAGATTNTSNETHIGEMHIHPPTGDPTHIAEQLREHLTNNTFMNQTNTGPE